MGQGLVDILEKKIEEAVSSGASSPVADPGFGAAMMTHRQKNTKHKHLDGDSVAAPCPDCQGLILWRYIIIGQLHCAQCVPFSPDRVRCWKFCIDLPGDKFGWESFEPTTEFCTGKKT